MAFLLNPYRLMWPYGDDPDWAERITLVHWDQAYAKGVRPGDTFTDETGLVSVTVHASATMDEQALTIPSASYAMAEFSPRLSGFDVDTVNDDLVIEHIVAFDQGTAANRKLYRDMSNDGNYYGWAIQVNADDTTTFKAMGKYPNGTTWNPSGQTWTYPQDSNFRHYAIRATDKTRLYCTGETYKVMSDGDGGEFPSSQQSTSVLFDMPGRYIATRFSRSNVSPGIDTAGVGGAVDGVGGTITGFGKGPPQP